VRTVVQRVTRARVVVENEVIGAIEEPGLVAFVGVKHGDTPDEARAVAAKLHNLRILRGDKSCADVGAPLLVVSQFTLYADTRKGRRPSWDTAAPGNVAQPLIDAVVAELRARGATVSTGRFGADMQLELINDGPVTLVLDTEPAAG
jgi:D-aminoacyl-tRNA deacylase